MCKEDDNKAIVGEWFTKFLGKTVDLSVPPGGRREERQDRRREGLRRRGHGIDAVGAD